MDISTRLLCNDLLHEQQSATDETDKPDMLSEYDEESDEEKDKEITLKCDRPLRAEIIELKRFFGIVFDALQMYKKQNEQLEAELAALKLQQDNGLSSMHTYLMQCNSDAHKQYMDDAEVRRKQLTKLHDAYMDHAEVRRKQLTKLHDAYMDHAKLRRVDNWGNLYFTLAVGVVLGVALKTVKSKR
jgi:hypothetical protein